MKTMKMKKVAKKVAVVIVMAMILTGCHEANTNRELATAAYELKSEITRLRIMNDDDSFWESADRFTKLVRDTIEDRVPIEIQFRLSCSGDIIYLNDFYKTELRFINNVVREMTANEIICEVLSSNEVMDMQAKDIAITGVILTWLQYEELYSICDLQCDGTWDYLSKGKFFFTEGNTAELKSADGEPLGIGVIDIEPTNIITLTENSKLSDLRKIATE